jgi:hypothetical protein
MCGRSRINVSGNETAVPTPLTLVLKWPAGLK